MGSSAAAGRPALPDVWAPAVSALPTWASNRAGRALVQQIIAEQPDYFPTVDEFGVEHHTYKGRAAGKLRRMHDDALGKATERANERNAAGQSWDQAAVELMKLHGEEKPDALIARLLREGAVARSAAA